MLIQRLISFSHRIRCNTLLGVNNLRLGFGASYSSTKSVKTEETDELNAPVKFSTTQAKSWRAESSRIGYVDTKRLWFEPYVIIGSISIFLIYFLILREENDVDVELTKSLYSRIEGLEEQQLRLSLQYNLHNGLETRDIVQRLEEIEREKINR